MMSTVFEVSGKDRMFALIIAGVEFYRPSLASDAAIRFKAEPALRKSFKPGTYTKFTDIQAILHNQVNFYGDLFDSLIPKLASRDFLDFVLWQYDLTGLIDDVAKEGSLRREALARWMSIGPSHRRTLKYVAERITMLAPSGFNNEMPSIALIDEAFICAEELIDYCITSDTTRLYPNDTKITIQPEGFPTYLDHEIANLRMQQYKNRVAVDTRMRNELFGKKNFEQEFLEHAQYLDEPLKRTIGATWLETLSIISSLRDGCRPARDNPYGTKFVLRNAVIEQLAAVNQKPREVIETILAGFSLQKDDLLARSNTGDYWNPQFEYRAYRRALFVMPHDLGPHFAFSNAMFDEALTIMQGEVCYGQFPTEWTSDATKETIGKIVTARGKWFEEQVQKHLSSIGIVGVASRTAIGRDKENLKLPGEFDFFGWSPCDNALVLLEAKMLQPSSEPRPWKNQMENFAIGGKNEEAFIHKLQRKSEWVVSNAANVIIALRDEGIPIHANPSRLLSGFISYSPLPASYFISEFPCVALSEFLSAYRSSGVWTYAQGIRALA